MSNILHYITPRSLILPLSFLVIGISAGIFFGGIIPSSEKNELASILQHHLTESNPHFVSAFIINLLLLCLIALAGFTVYGFPLALLLLLGRGFAVGFCDHLLLYIVNEIGFFKFTISFMLPQLILCIIYFFVTAVSISYAVQYLRR